VVCGQGTVCNAGTCVPGTAPPMDGGAPTCPNTTCLLPTGGTTCTDLARDPMNCGACGKVCPGGYYCGGGNCQSVNQPDGGTMTTCPVGVSQCTLAGSPSYCADLLHDPRNCGSCGFACGATQSCMDGKCLDGAGDAGMDAAINCPAGLIPCSGATGLYCADPARDRNNCGACGKICDANAICVSGQCQPGATGDGGAPPPTCVQPQMTCTDPNGQPICVDVTIDRNNCGKCGQVCPAMQGCVQSVCKLVCQQPLVPCKDPAGALYCAALDGDNFNCGSCGITCAAGTTCQQGVCR
jgi:hypothetical protein